MSFPNVEKMSPEEIGEFLKGLDAIERSSAEKVVGKRLAAAEAASSLEAELRAAAAASKVRADELEAELRSREEWEGLVGWLGDLAKKHGPDVIKALLGAAVGQALERLKP